MQFKPTALSTHIFVRQYRRYRTTGPQLSGRDFHIWASPRFRPGPTSGAYSTKGFPYITYAKTLNVRRIKRTKGLAEISVYGLQQYFVRCMCIGNGSSQENFIIIQVWMGAAFVDESSLSFAFYEDGIAGCCTVVCVYLR